MSDSLLQKSWKNNLRPYFNPNPISSSFLIHCEWFKTWWAHQLELYKASLNFKGKDTTIPDSNLKILIYFNSSIMEHRNLLHLTPHIFPINLRSRLWKLEMKKIIITFVKIGLIKILKIKMWYANLKYHVIFITFGRYKKQFLFEVKYHLTH
jgi:hypothetical protein